MRLPFCILIVLGDVLDDGDLHFLEAAKTLEAARKRIEALADLLPGEYVVYNPHMGEYVSIKSGRQKQPNQPRTRCCDLDRRRVERA